MKNVSDKSCTETENTHLKFNNFFFSENRAIGAISCKAGQTTDDNTSHAHCVLDT